MINRQSSIVNPQSGGFTLIKLPVVRKGFTLIELLVVVAIISLLVSILLPSLNRAKGLARRVLCMTNMRQLGIAQHVYAGDNSNHFTYRWTQPGDLTWTQRLAPYVGVDDPYRYYEAKVFECPDWQPWEGRTESGYPNSGVRAFGLNYHTRADEWLYRRSVVPKPSETVLMGETNANHESHIALPWDPVLPSEAPNVETHYRLSHLGGGTANYLMVDGRVESLEGIRWYDDDYPTYLWW